MPQCLAHGDRSFSISNNFAFFSLFFPVADAAAVWTHIILALIAAHVALKTPRNPSADYTASIMAEKCC